MTLASLLLAAVFVTAAQAAAPRASLAEIEPQVMCVTCKIPLNVAVSPQANRERAFIQSLIDEGKDESQIKREMVAQYGSAVLALPAAHGFDLTVYLVPLAAVLLLAGTWLVLLPRWRRRAREQAAKRIAVQPLAPTDAARLDSDLARFD
jgi:cytochrome c-type biogenesis protein CcmH